MQQLGNAASDRSDRGAEPAALAAGAVGVPTAGHPDAASLEVDKALVPLRDRLR